MPFWYFNQPGSYAASVTEKATGADLSHLQKNINSQVAAKSFNAESKAYAYTNYLYDYAYRSNPKLEQFKTNLSKESEKLQDIIDHCIANNSDTTLVITPADALLFF